MTDELGALMDTLACEHHVYVRHGRLPAAPVSPGDWPEALADEVHVLVAEVNQHFIERDYVPRSAEMSPAGIRAGLEPLTSERAVDLMAELASQNLLWPDHHYLDSDLALATASHAADLLGPSAHWWSNRDEYSAYRINAYALDGVVASTDGTRFVVLIQVAED